MTARAPGSQASATPLERHRARLPRARSEVISVGFDEALELTGAAPIATGLRVPPIGGQLFRFLCCVADLSASDAIVGLRLFATIGQDINEGGEIPPPAPIYPEWRPIVTPGWHFVDTGPIVWSITYEPLANFHRVAGPVDQTSFQQYHTTGPALVYETATFPPLPPLPGYLGLSSYTPPAIRGIVQYAWRDIRYPEQQNEFWAYLRPIERPTRVRLYADVTQTNPSTRFAPTFTPSAFSAGMVPEELFIQAFPQSQYHTVGGALVYDRNRPKGLPC